MELPTDAPSSYRQYWDKDTKHGIPASDGTIQAANIALDLLRQRRNTATTKWLNGLADQIVVSDENNNTGANDELTKNLIQKSLVQLLDELFNQLEAYACQFNQKVQGTDLIVSCTRPDTINNPTTPNYEGRLTTRYWAMFMRASLSKIEVFIIPAEFLLGFSSGKVDKSAYQPSFVLESTWLNNQPVWHINKTRISDHIQTIAEEIFADLIQMASGEMNDSERANQTSDFKLAFPLNSLTMAEQLMQLVNEDINKLMAEGKNALQAENNDTFEQIKIITQKMDTFKQSVLDALSQLKPYV